MPLEIWYSRLAGGRECIDILQCREYLTCARRGENPPVPIPGTLKFFYLTPDGKRWIQAFGEHRYTDGYMTSDGRYFPAGTHPDPRWTYIETHPVVVAHTFIIDGTPLPPELEPFRELADGPAFTEWLSRRGGGFPGSQEAREAEARRLLEASQGGPDAGLADPSSDPSTTPATPPEATRGAKGTPGVQPDEFTSTMRDILTATCNLKAFDRTSCRPFPEIVKEAGLSSPTARNVRDAYGRLRDEDTGLMKAKRGQNGGCWITAKGRQAIGYT
jgi:hypothetical protein